jgi:hypothetical protein
MSGITILSIEETFKDILTVVDILQDICVDINKIHDSIITSDIVVDDALVQASKKKHGGGIKSINNQILIKNKTKNNLSYKKSKNNKRYKRSTKNTKNKKYRK